MKQTLFSLLLLGMCVNPMFANRVFYQEIPEENLSRGDGDGYIPWDDYEYFGGYVFGLNRANFEGSLTPGSTYNVVISFLQSNSTVYSIEYYDTYSVSISDDSMLDYPYYLDGGSLVGVYGHCGCGICEDRCFPCGPCGPNGIYNAEGNLQLGDDTLEGLEGSILEKAAVYASFHLTLCECYGMYKNDINKIIVEIFDEAE